MPVRTKVKNPWFVPVIFNIIVILLLPVIIPLILIFLIPWIKIRYIQRPKLLWKVKKQWLPAGKFILFVYSDNELWKDYAEKNIIPKIKPHAIILNWSRRKEWINSDSLEAQLFRNFNWRRKWTWKLNTRMGGQDYNHFALVFKPWVNPKLINFWQAFKDYEFGKNEKLKKVEEELLSSLKD